MSPLKTVFFGTQQFAATILQGMIDNPLFDITLVITQPDRPIGRHQEMQKSPAKLIAEAHAIPVLQPETLKGFELPETDIAIVAQYGLIIPARLLSAPKHGMINVHGSLLPLYRGATPIQTALLNGDKKTGTTIMVMDAGMDTGPILLQAELPITKEDNFSTLETKLADISAPLLGKAVEGYVDGTLKPVPQDESKATICKLLTRDDGKIDWHTSAEAIYHQFQGMTPWPGIWCTWQGKRLKLLAIDTDATALPPGTVQAIHDTILIGTVEGSIRVSELQLEGKKVMDAKTFLNGFRQFDGSHVE